MQSSNRYTKRSIHTFVVFGSVRHLPTQANVAATKTVIIFFISRAFLVFSYIAFKTPSFVNVGAVDTVVFQKKLYMHCATVKYS